MGYRVAKKAWQYVQPFWYNTSVWRTDRRTDGRTDVQPISITCFSIADARNKTIALHIAYPKSNCLLFVTTGIESYWQYCVCSARRRIKTSRHVDEEMTLTRNVELTSTAASVVHRSTPTSSLISIIVANYTPRNCDWLGIWRESVSAAAIWNDILSHADLLSWLKLRDLSCSWNIHCSRPNAEQRTFTNMDCLL